MPILRAGLGGKASQILAGVWIDEGLAAERFAVVGIDEDEAHPDQLVEPQAHAPGPIAYLDGRIRTPRRDQIVEPVYSLVAGPERPPIVLKVLDLLGDGVLLAAGVVLTLLDL